MDGDSLCWIEIAIFVIFVILGGYFAGSESCFSAMNRIRIKSQADNGDRKAKNAMYIANNFDRALTTLLIGNNITHIAAASVATLFVTQKWGENGVLSDSATLISTFVTTGIVFLFSEMIPKSFANDRAETMALACAASLRVLMKIFTPLVAFFGWISDFFSRLFQAKEEPSITEDELIEIIQTAEDEGVVDEAQSDLLQSAIEFRETCASDVMTMREDIMYLDIHTPKAEMVRLVKEIPHSRIPVVDGSLDKVVGILPIREFLKRYIDNPKFDLRSILLKPHFVGEDDTVSSLLDYMRQHKIYISLVLDEEKQVRGMVTIEDFLEELVGEIWDEDDNVDPDFFKLGGNRFSVSADLKTGDVYERMGLVCEDARVAGYTVSVWITDYLGRLPEEDESFMYGDLEITVEKVSETRILTVVIHIPDEDEIEELRAEYAAEDSEAGEEAAEQ